ncbi:acid phosphatase [Phenylobacterium montanum]|uniref:Acid phosphatase n=1 Tax=Phenylobacterium montanum TaxID=2823693 RepID=A0A975FW24_9CAUL|nr:phosphatase PAP2 family protein [Caulobacter sp. S6]QUD86002.1 phosphatase PAP2 family protein [Caulobacter sp. S6]
MSSTHHALGIALILAAGPALAGGYLAPGAAPDAARILPPPPAPGSGRAAEDRAVFEATRALKGQPRWDLAVSDADLAADTALEKFACALGVRIMPSSAPALSRILARSEDDAEAVYGPAKKAFARPRPFTAPGEEAAPLCVTRTPELARSFSYPSGDATLGWAWGLILAELAPSRSSEILMRARSIGESRVVCGVHNPSDVEASRTAGAALVAALHANAEFRADMDKARAEVTAVLAAPHGAEQCSVQDAAAAKSPY